MTKPLDRTIFIELIKEIKNILSEMEELLFLMTDKDSNKKQITKKLYNLSNSIMGVSSMANIDELTDTATLTSKVLDDIIKNKLILSPRLIKAMTKTIKHIKKYCSALETKEDVNDQLFQNTLSTLNEFTNLSWDDADEPDNPIEKPEDDIFSPISKSGDSDIFFEDLDLDIFDEDEIPIDMQNVLADVQENDSMMADIDPDFLESFNEESKDHLNNIAQQLNLLSPVINNKTNLSLEYREILHSIRRSVHTLKGAAAVIGIKSVASFGNEFEDFLDWLHDESNNLSPDIITVMLDGTDILEKLSVSPKIKIDNAIENIKSVFKKIISNAHTAGLKEEQRIELDIIHESICKLPDQSVYPPAEKPIDQIANQPEIKQVKISKTLRVDMEKLDRMIGLIGDMSINLSSHENSSKLLEATLNEFDNSIQRLHDITSNLETKFELAAIPHHNSIIKSIQKEEQGIDINEFDPLEMDRYSDLHVMTRSLNEATADLNSIMNQTMKVQNLWKSVMSRQNRVITEIQDSMQLIKMTPFSTLSNRLHKTVRESARVTKKAVRLVLEGDSLEMDTHVWNVLADPLMHLLRNAVDHGIETAEERKKTNKPKQATIRIKCIRRGSRLNMHFSDDGKGLNYDAIRARALKLYPKINVSILDNDELNALIFKQGFTIKTKATTISGRGVGMDVVDYAVRQLNGNIEVLSMVGKGTEFILRLPIAVAQLPALLVKFGQQEFAVPLHDIKKVFRIDRKLGTKNSIKLNDTTLPLLRPVELLGLKPIIQTTKDNPIALSINVDNKNGVLLTDAIIGKKNIIFKDLGSHLHNQVPCIAGATIMGDGSLVPILNTQELFSRQITPVKHRERANLEARRENNNVNILIVDDSISIRKVLSNFITNQGWQSSVAKDGVDAMQMIRQRPFDLILLDIEMPRMNGFDVLQSLQRHSDERDTPVLMLTSRSAKKYKDRAIELGASGFVTKPFKDDELLSLINSLLPNKKTETGK